MSLIGVFTEPKKEKTICRLLKNKLHNHPNTIIIINKGNIENLRNVQFEILLIMQDMVQLTQNKEMIGEMLKRAKHIVLNTDIELNLEGMKNFSNPIITYGFNSKATITASSIEEDRIQLCIQRKIVDNKNGIIEPQEINISIDNEENLTSNEWIGILSLLTIEKSIARNR